VPEFDFARRRVSPRTPISPQVNRSANWPDAVIISILETPVPPIQEDILFVNREIVRISKSANMLGEIM
jgi:hypothetical protein